MFPRSVTRTPFTAADYALAGRQLTEREFYDYSALPGDDIWDVTTLRGRPGGKEASTVPIIGTQLKSMVPGGINAVVSAAGGLGFDGKAITLNRAQAPNIDLGSRVLAIGDMFMHWTSFTQFQPGANNRIVYFGGPNQFAVIVIADGNGTPANLEVYAPNSDTAPVPADIIQQKLGDGLIHLWAYHLVPVNTPGKYRVDIYIDKVLVGSTGEYNFIVPASTQLQFGAGNGVSAGTGRLFRLRKSNSVTAGMVGSSIVAKEYDAWAARIRA